MYTCPAFYHFTGATLCLFLTYICLFGEDYFVTYSLQSDSRLNYVWSTIKNDIVDHKILSFVGSKV